MSKIKSGSTVVIITGDDKGKTAVVKSIKGEKCYLENIRVFKRAKKGKGYSDVHLPIHISNVKLVD